MRIDICWLILVSTISFTNQTMAENLGKVGSTWAADDDGREQFKSVMKRKQDSGELDKFWIEYRKKAINSIKNPEALGVPSGTFFTKQYFTPRFVAPQDYKDNKGRVLVKKGTVVMPLRQQPLRYQLAFIDGRDSQQVQYAIGLGKVTPTKIILVGGSAYQLRTDYKSADWLGQKGIPFYFDQRKMIINSLNKLYGININYVPAVLTQDGDGLTLRKGYSSK